MTRKPDVCHVGPLVWMLNDRNKNLRTDISFLVLIAFGLLSYDQYVRQNVLTQHDCWVLTIKLHEMR